MQLPMSLRQSAQLIDFVEFLVRWNGVYNLTSIRDRSDMLTLHVVDCLAAVLPLRRKLTAAAPVRILDVGSGGGLPGLVMAIMEPEADVTCVDSVGKKAAFVRQAATSLELGNLHVKHGRVEALSVGEPYDIIMSRAFGSLTDFTGLTAGLLAETGLWMAMKGKVPEDEIDKLSAGVQVFHVERLVVPGVEAQRCLIWMRSPP